MNRVLFLENEKLDHLTTLAREVSAREGCFLYHLDVNLKGKGRRVCVYIDKEDKGANVEDCANVSRALSLLLDVEDVIPGEQYELEVSTPGLERILKEQWHYEKVIGEKVQVRTNTLVKHPELSKQNPRYRGVKTLRGVLASVNEAGIFVKTSEPELEWEILFDQIHKSNVIFEVPHAGSEKLKN